MKKSHLLSLLLLSVVLTGCDAPTRLRQTTATQNLATNPTGGTDTGFGGTTSGTTTSGTTTGTTSGATGLPTGFTTCNTSTSAYYSTATGNMSVCQSTTDETQIRAQFTTDDQSDGTCFIPTYKDGSGSSTYLGTAQCTKHTSGQIMYGQLYKNRSGYSAYSINGVMVMKYSATNAYFQCMNGYQSGYSSCMTSTCQPYYYNASQYQACMNSYNSSCDASAKSYMNQLCNTFKNGYSYIDIKLK